VTADVLRQIPVARLIVRAVGSDVLGGLVRIRETTPGSSAVTPVSVAELPEPIRTAVIYRTALFVNEPPTAAVAEAAGISQEAAAKRVQRAREAGLLEPTTRGRKGA
jgi:hypothetical protein